MIFRRWLFTLGAAFAWQVASAEPYTWKNVEIQGGGFVTGIVMHPAQQNLLYARTDVGGAYRWNAAAARWVALTDHLTDGNLYGVESLAVDPSDPNRVYLAVGSYVQSWAGNGALLRSSDQGATWLRTDLPLKMGGNETGRANGERLAVDPHRGQILFFGSRQNGLWKSTDSGATWANVGSFPAFTDTNDVGIVVVHFVKASGTTGNATPEIYAGVSTRAAASLYRSTDGGTSWAAVAGQPVGLRPTHLVQAANGTFYLSYGDEPGPGTMDNGAVWRYVPGTGIWTNISPATPTSSVHFGYGAVAVDAANPNVVMVTTFNRWTTGDDIYRSTNGGTSWKALQVRAAANLDNTSSPLAASLSPHWMGDVEIDPFDPKRAYFVTGYGIFRSVDATVNDASTQAVKWTFWNAGLEETVPLKVCSPPTGAPLLSVIGDFDGFRHDNLLAPPPVAARHNPRFGTSRGLDFAGGNPSYHVRAGSNGARGAYSTDGAITWTAFSTQPVNATDGGRLAVAADASRIVWTPTGAVLSYSTDQGATWTASTGVTPTLEPIADRVNPNRFYAYDSTAGRLYASTNGAVSFTQTAAVLSTGGTTPVAVPGLSGELWFPAPNSGLYRTTDFGLTFAKITTVQQGYRVGFGLPAPGQTHPTVFLSGKVNNVSGVFRSDDSGATWTEVTDVAHKFGFVNTLTGDPRIYGRVYVGTGGRGIVYGDVESPGGPLPAGWVAQDIGALTPPGAAGLTSGLWTLRGAGTDIWGTSDQFHFASQAAAGDLTISARVTRLDNTNTWAKAGLMIRDGTATGAMNACVLQTPGSNGVSFQTRASTGGTSASTSVANVPVGSWIRLVRSGNIFTAAYSLDGATWTPFGSPVTVAMPTTVRAGLCVTSHTTGTLATATFTNVVAAVSPFVITTPSPLAAGAADLSTLQTLAATGGGPGRIWSLLSGQLPAGLSLSSAGLLSGTPMETGSFTFTIRVADSLGNTGQQPYTLAVSQPTFSGWAEARFTPAQMAAPAVSGNAADPDGDGVPNLFEWAQRREPLKAEAGGVLTWSLENDVAGQPKTMIFTFPRRRNLAGVTWSLEISSTLQSWSDTAQYSPAWQTTPEANGITETVKVTLDLPVQFRQRASVRLRITPVP